MVADEIDDGPRKRVGVVGNDDVAARGDRQPSAPIVVETTARPMAIASNIFSRVPPPIRSGTT